MEDRNYHCGALMKRLAEILNKNANNDLAMREVTFSQMRVLIMLNEVSEDSAASKEVEKYFGFTQSTIAGIIDRLEKKGLVEGFTDPEDKRRKRVRITQKGKNLCEETKVSMDNYETWFLKSLTEEEKSELSRLLLKIYNDVQ